MNWQAKHLTTVDKEKIWKEYVAREAEHRGVYDEYRQRVTEQTRDPDVKLSPRGKRFLAKESYGVQMVTDPDTGRLTPVLSDRVVRATGGATSPTRRPVASPAPESGGVDSMGSTFAEGSLPAASSPKSTGVKLPTIPLSSAMLQQQQQQQQSAKSPLASTSPSAYQQQAVVAPGQHFIYARGSPRKGPNASTQSALQKQFLINNFSSSGSHHHGGGNSPDAALDRSLKNLQFMSTSNSTIGRGTVEMLQGVPVGGLRSSPLASGAVSPTSAEAASSAAMARSYGQSSSAAVGGEGGEFGATLSGALRSTYLGSTTSPLKRRGEYIPGSPRSYVVTDAVGGSVMFDYGRKQCDITKMSQELPLRK